MNSLTPSEFKALYDSTPNRNKMIKKERDFLYDLVAVQQRPAWIYSGGKNLNAKGSPPNFNKARFVIRHKELIWYH